MATKAELERANEALVTERDRLLEDIQELQEANAELARALPAPPHLRRCPVLRAGRAVRRLVTGRATGWLVAAVIAANAAVPEEWELLELLDGKLP